MNSDDLTPEQRAAYDKMMAAMTEWGKIMPSTPPPTDPVNLVPTLRHANPESFRLGYNIWCDAGGYMPDRILVLVVPLRPGDLRRYRCKRTSRSLYRALGLPLE